MRTGHAVILLTIGYAYEGRTEVDGSFVHFSGQRAIGDERYAVEDHTWPPAMIDSIRWLA